MKTLSIVPFTTDDLKNAQDMAVAFEQSGLFPGVQGKAQCFVKIIAGAEFGMTPFQAMAGLHVMKGKVELSANAMAAMVKASDKYDYRVRSKTREKCELEFFEAVDGKRESLGVETWDKERSKRAGLSGGNHEKFAEAMMFARCLSAGIRTFCPDALSVGAPVYAIGEVSDNVMGPDGDLEEAEAVIDLGTPDIVKPPAKKKRASKKKPAPSEEAPYVEPPKTLEDESLYEKDPTTPSGPSGEAEPSAEPNAKEDPEEDIDEVLAGDETIPDDYRTPNGDPKKSNLGLTFREWTDLAEDVRVSQGHVSEAQIRMITSKAKKAGYSVEKVEESLQNGYGCDHLWQLGKKQAGQIINKLMKKAKAK